MSDVDAVVQRRLQAAADAMPRRVVRALRTRSGQVGVLWETSRALAIELTGVLQVLVVEHGVPGDGALVVRGQALALRTKVVLDAVEAAGAVKQ